MLQKRLGVFTGLCAAAGLLIALVPGVTPGPASAQGASAGATGPGLPSLASGEQPNIVLITADDMRADDLAFMPRTKKLLARAGVTFTNALSNYPLCCPARATLLTGQYSHNHGVKGNEYPYGGYKKFYESGAELETLAVWLQRAGYNTGFVGKYLNHYGSTNPNEASSGPTYIPPGWNDWHAVAQNLFWYYCPTINDNGTLHRYRNQYQTDLYTQMGENFIGRYAGRKPFFLWESHLAPHLGKARSQKSPCRVGPGMPTPPAKRHEGMFSGIPLPKSPATNEADLSDKGTYINFRDKLDLRHQRLVHEGRLESLQALDESVAATVAALKAKGVLSNTMIVFASDNGWLLGEHRLEKKIYPYEESLTVPILVRGPGFPTGVRRNQTVGLVDIPATALDVSGAVATKPQDGVSLLGLAQDRTLLARRVMPIEAGPVPALQSKYNATIPGWYYRGARSGRYSYFAWQFDASEEEEFYDLKADPFQLTSRHKTPSKALDAMRRLSKLMENCAGQACVQTLPEGVDVDVKAWPSGDTTAPRVGNVRAPKGWIRHTRPTIRYSVSDATNRTRSLRQWCSDQATGCDGQAILHLHGEGRHNWTIQVTDPAGNAGAAYGTIGVDLRAPRVRPGAALRAVAERLRAGVSWQVTDSASGVRSTDTRRRTAGLTGGFDAWSYPSTLQNQARPPRSVRLPGHNGTVCLQVRAKDRVGRESSWTAEQCRSRAIDAAAVTSGRGWRTFQRDGWYAGTANLTSRRGSALLVPSSGGIGLIRLVARTGPGMGTLRLSVGGTFVKRLNLDRSDKGLAEFLVPTPGLSGRVKATVVSSNEPVWVDSIGVVRRPGR